MCETVNKYCTGGSFVLLAIIVARAMHALAFIFVAEALAL
jgi:hypothetical protein